MISDDSENLLAIEKVTEIVGKTRNYGSTAKDLKEEQRHVEIRLREKEEVCQTDAMRRKEHEDQRAHREEEQVRKNSLWMEKTIGILILDT